MRLYKEYADMDKANELVLTKSQLERLKHQLLSDKEYAILDKYNYTNARLKNIIKNTGIDNYVSLIANILINIDDKLDKITNANNKQETDKI